MSQKKELESTVQQILTLLKEKGELTPHPENGVEVVLIKENRIGGSYTVSIAVGKVSAISNRYFDVRGQVFDDSFSRFSDNSLRIEPKTITSTKGVQYTCFVFTPGLIRAVDEATWANKFVTLADLVNLIENLGKQGSFSFFTTD